MKLYSENKDYKLYQGNMLDMLEVIEPNTIDSIVTDPPYELNFMGKGWDNAGVSFNSDTWKKCYDVLKEGGYLLAFGGSRTYHRIAVAIEDAGFEIRDTIMWLYGSGFPKSMDISKQIDKRPNAGITNLIKFGNYIKKARERKKLSKKELGKLLFDFKSNREDVPIQSWEIGKEIPKKEVYKKLKEILELNDDMDFIFEEAEREIIGEKIDPDGKPRSARYKNIVSNPSAWNTLGSKEKMEKATYITAPSTDLAKQWQGWGTCLKPSFEPIIVARKPFKGSLVDNVIKSGVGGINIDECRVEYEKTTNPLYRQQNADKYKQVQGGELSNGAVSWTSGKNGVNEGGRFPANTILTYDETDFEEVCGGFPNTKSQKGQISNKGSIGGSGIYGGTNNDNVRNIGFNDSGSASRYFYCAKASKKDRDEGLDEFEEKENTIMYGDGFNSATKLATRQQIETGEVGNRSLRKNTHPTVKPTSLMQYLVRLVTPNGGTILDPFNGSGSTGKAVMYENKDRNKNYKYIGIELTEEYLPIAKARIDYVCNLKEEQPAKEQISIFDLDVSNSEVKEDI